MKLKHLLAIGLLSLVPALGNAAEQANAPTATGETGLFTIMTGDTLPRGGWSFGLYYNNWDRVLDLDFLDVEEESVDWNRLSASVGYGITDRWELSLAVPYDDYDFDFRGFDADVSGLGNAILGTKFRLLGNAGDPTTLALNLFAELPTGDDDIASDDAGFGAGLGWRVNNWAFDVKYRDPGEPFGEELKGGIGYVGQVSERFDWITELVGTFYSANDDFDFDDVDEDEDFAPFDDSYDLTTGGRLWLGEEGNWAFNFALRTNLASLSDIDEHCPIGGLLGLTYFPRFFERPAPPPPPPPPAPEPPPPPPPPPPAPAPKPEERVTVNFTPGSARLSNIAKAKLDEVALRMKQDPDARALVIGYSDPSGSSAANQRISEQRAEAVKNYLVTRHGIDPSRIRTEGRGSAESTGDPEQDRRAVVILTFEG